MRAPFLAAVLAAAAYVAPAAVPPRSTSSGVGPVLPVLAVESVGFTVSDLDRAVEFYTRVLSFAEVRRTEHAGRAFELLTGVFGASARSVRLRLGDEQIELTEFLAPRGRPMPQDLRANDRAFQHIAIVVRDVQEAYARLRAAGVEHASTGPQRLPDWNPNAGGIGAFYFRDPDRHYLELIEFPAGKGARRWQDNSTLFLGIDHTAIVVGDTERSLRLYRDTLGLLVAGESENYDVEQEYLNNVFGARLRITALRAESGPGIELLEYLAPSDGRPAPPDLKSNDIAHWHTALVTNGLQELMSLARQHRMALVSPGPVALEGAWPDSFTAGALARDPDGHGLRFVTSSRIESRLPPAAPGTN